MAPAPAAACVTPCVAPAAPGAELGGALPPFTRLGAMEEEEELGGMLEMLPLEVLALTELAPALVDVVEAVADAVRGYTEGALTGSSRSAGCTVAELSTELRDDTERADRNEPFSRMSFWW